MNELREILQESVNRLFADLVTRECLSGAENGEWPGALWTALEENGLTNPLSPEDQGGVGASWADTFVIIRAAGRFAAPVPLAETIIAGWLAGEAGLTVPSGPLTVAAGGRSPALTLDRVHGDWRLSGTVPAVPWGTAAGTLVTTADRDGETRLVAVATAEAVSRGDQNIAREPRDTLTFEAAPAEIGGPVTGGASGDLIRLYGAMVRSAQIAGATERALGEALQYAKDRVQFGRPIAKFQAIQHRLATLAAQSAQATIAAESAFRAADRGDPEFEIACAKIVAGEAAATATSVAHQVHGAIGFTYEHALHFSTRRLWSWRAEFGSESQWAEELGRKAAARGADALWPDLTQRQRAADG